MRILLTSRFGKRFEPPSFEGTILDKCYKCVQENKGSGGFICGNRSNRVLLKVCKTGAPDGAGPLCLNQSYERLRSSWIIDFGPSLEEYFFKQHLLED